MDYMKTSQVDNAHTRHTHPAHASRQTHHTRHTHTEAHSPFPSHTQTHIHLLTHTHPLTWPDRPDYERYPRACQRPGQADISLPE